MKGRVPIRAVPWLRGVGPAAAAAVAVAVAVAIAVAADRRRRSATEVSLARRGDAAPRHRARVSRPAESTHRDGEKKKE